MGGWPHYGGYYYGKRSADSEPTPAADAKAEPWYYGGYGYGYAWPHYGGYYYGKRSADSEPTPAADQRLGHGIMAATDTHGHTMVATIMERGLLTLNHPLLPMQRLSHGIMAAMDTVGHTTVTTGVKLSTESVT